MNSPAKIPRRWGRGSVVSTGLRVTVAGRRTAVPLDVHVGTWRIDSIVTLAAATRADSTYLLVDVRGRSRANDGGGYCGAGTEGDLVWVKLAGGRVRDLRTAPYESCLRTLGGDDELYERNADSLWFDRMIWRGKREVSIRYWFADPARGMLALVDTVTADSLPRYPRPLAFANVEGEVTARLIPVRHEPFDSVEIVHQSHPLFGEAVRTAASEWQTQRWPDTTLVPIVLTVRFDPRTDAACGTIGAPTPPYARPVGYRAFILPASSPRDLRMRVEACGTTSTRRAVTH